MKHAPDDSLTPTSAAATVAVGETEPIPLQERHGHARNLLWTWSSPNMQFAVILVGVISVLYFGQSLWSAVLAIILGNLLASVFHAILTSFGPSTGLPQLTLSRRAFGYLGNVLPAGLNAFLAGIGWFAVNSVIGALALSTLTGWSVYLCLMIGGVLTLAVAFGGHNIVHLFQRLSFPLLLVCFAIGMVFVFGQADPAAASDPIPGAFWMTFGASFGLTAGWNPLAADYSRYLPPNRSRAAGIYAGIGLFVTSTALQITGAAAVTAVGINSWNPDNPTESYTGLFPSWFANIALLGIFAGAMAANSMNLYSASLSFSSLGLSLQPRFGRNASTVAMAVVGLTVAWIAADSVDAFQGFLLILAYWIGPWLGVILTDRALYWNELRDTVCSNRHFWNPAGPIAMLVAAALSIWLFSNQTYYVGIVPSRFPEVGDITFVVGMAAAAVIYWLIRRLTSELVVRSASSSASGTVATELPEPALQS